MLSWSISPLFSFSFVTLSSFSLGSCHKPLGRQVHDCPSYPPRIELSQSQATLPCAEAGGVPGPSGESSSAFMQDVKLSSVIEERKKSHYRAWGQSVREEIKRLKTPRPEASGPKGRGWGCSKGGKQVFRLLTLPRPLEEPGRAVCGRWARGMDQVNKRVRPWSPRHDCRYPRLGIHRCWTRSASHLE